MKIIILLLFFAQINALKILGIFPHEGKSHFDVFEPLLKTLAQKGHELTVISHFPQVKPIKNYKDISIRGENIYLNVVNMEIIPRYHLKFIDGTYFLHLFAQKSCAHLKNDGVMALSRSNTTFDVAIVEFFNTDCFLSLINKMEVPFIGLSSHTIMPWASLRLSTSANPSFVPVLFSPFDDKMSFWQRFENTLYYVYSNAYYHWVMLPYAEKEARKVFGDDMPRLDDIGRNVSLFLVNTHFSLNRPKNFPPNVIEIGGMFLGNHKPIPKVRFCVKFDYF